MSSSGVTSGSDATLVDVRSRLALALDVDDAVEALQLARALRPWFGVAKVGLELFTAGGPDVVVRLIDDGFDVFLDLKLHDIPNTVSKAARVAGSLGVKYLTMHAMGGADMLRGGVEGFVGGAEAAGLSKPVALAITILTSDDTAPHHILGKRLMAAMEAGCGGVVCAASDLHEVGQLAPRMVRVVPGIRPESAETHDQARAATPTAAVAGGADVLVIGRAVTQAPDREAAATAITAEIRAAITSAIA